MEGVEPSPSRSAKRLGEGSGRRSVRGRCPGRRRARGGEKRELRPWAVVMRRLQHQRPQGGPRVLLPPAPLLSMTAAGSGSRRAPLEGARSARQGGAKPVRRVPPALSLLSVLPGPGRCAAVPIRICCESPDRGGLAVLHSSVRGGADPRCPSGALRLSSLDCSYENRYLPQCQVQAAMDSCLRGPKWLCQAGHTLCRSWSRKVCGVPQRFLIGSSASGGAGDRGDAERAPTPICRPPVPRNVGERRIGRAAVTRRAAVRPRPSRRRVP
jgi:hypothetical protein